MINHIENDNMLVLKLGDGLGYDLTIFRYETDFRRIITIHVES